MLVLDVDVDVAVLCMGQPGWEMLEECGRGAVWKDVLEASGRHD